MLAREEQASAQLELLGPGAAIEPRRRTDASATMAGFVHSAVPRGVQVAAPIFSGAHQLPDITIIDSSFSVFS